VLLKEIYNQILREQGEEASQVIEFPKEKFTVSIDKNRKKLIFSPQESSALPNKIRPMVLMLKRNFNITSIQSQENNTGAKPEYQQTMDVDLDDPNLQGVILVQLDPRENVDKVVEFLSSQVGQ
jgi:hypothetical protein